MPKRKRDSDKPIVPLQPPVADLLPPELVSKIASHVVDPRTLALLNYGGPTDARDAATCFEVLCGSNRGGLARAALANDPRVLGELLKRSRPAPCCPKDFHRISSGIVAEHVAVMHDHINRDEGDRCVGGRALTLAAYHGKEQAVRAILEACAADHAALDCCQEATAFMLAAYGRHTEIVRLLLPRLERAEGAGDGGGTGDAEGAGDGEGSGRRRIQTVVDRALSLACDEGGQPFDIETVRAVLEGRPSRRACESVLCSSAVDAVVELLLALPPPFTPSAECAHGRALSVAAFNGRLGVARALLDAAPTRPLDNLRALAGAAEAGHDDVVRLLIDRWHDRQTALDLLRELGHAERFEGGP